MFLLFIPLDFVLGPLKSFFVAVVEAIRPGHSEMAAALCALILDAA